MVSINEKITEIRLSKGIKQSDVARAAGLKQPSYASIEKGETKSITIEAGKGIAAALGISFNELFEIESPSDSKIKNHEDEKEKLNKRISDIEKMLSLQEQVNQNLRSAILEAYDWANYKDGGIDAFLERETIENDKPNEIQLFVSDFYRRLISRGCITSKDIETFIDNELKYLNKKMQK